MLFAFLTYLYFTLGNIYTLVNNTVGIYISSVFILIVTSSSYYFLVLTESKELEKSGKSIQVKKHFLFKASLNIPYLRNFFGLKH